MSNHLEPSIDNDSGDLFKVGAVDLTKPIFLTITLLHMLSCSLCSIRFRTYCHARAVDGGIAKY
jgi:hypothetical protein